MKHCYDGTMVELAALKSLPPAERMQLVEDLWDSLIEVESNVPVPRWQQEELRVREEFLKKNPACTSTWNESKARIRTGQPPGA